MKRTECSPLLTAISIVSQFGRSQNSHSILGSILKHHGPWGLNELPSGLRQKFFASSIELSGKSCCPKSWWSEMYSAQDWHCLPVLVIDNLPVYSSSLRVHLQAKNTRKHEEFNHNKHLELLWCVILWFTLMLECQI